MNVTTSSGNQVFTFSDNTGACTTTWYSACPDLMTIDHIGVADNWRGRLIRCFFQIMRLWPPKQGGS